MNRNPAELFRLEKIGSCAAAIGAFDGVHLGHRHILKATADYAEKHGLASAAILFDPLPSQFFGRLGKNQRILLHSEQVDLIRRTGIDHVVTLPFSQELADLSPEDFLNGIMTAIPFQRLFMGEDFSIGRNRSGTADILGELGKRLGFGTEVFQKDVLDGDVISSTRIRSLLSEGHVDKANRLLGYDFFFSGEIIHGEARGRKLGFPTLNVRIPEEKIRMPNGVYAVFNTIDGKRYPSVTNIGIRPTFGLEDKGVMVESFLLDASGDFYGERSSLEFIKMLRPEIRFESADALREQVSRDIERAKIILNTEN